MKLKYIIIIGLLILIAVLFGVDIFTGIWYWNRSNLIFDSETFNNILTPILAFIAIIIYSIALFTSIKQNKILHNQNIKPYYLKAIKKLRNKAKKTRFNDLGVFDGKKINLLNYTTFLFKSITKLTKSSDFVGDYKDFENNIKHNYDYYKDRDYYIILLFILDFTIGFDLKFCYDEIKMLIEEVNSSNLLDDEKTHIKKRIKSDLSIDKYIAFIDFFDKKDKNFIPFVPMVFDRLNNPNEVEYKSITNTSLKNPYKWFKQELE